jgi:hypothetical protein
MGWRTQQELPAKTIVGRAKVVAWLEKQVADGKAAHLRLVKPTERCANYDSLLLNYQDSLIDRACNGKTPLLKTYTWRLIGTFDEKLVIPESLKNELRIDGRRTQLQKSDWEEMATACIKARHHAKDSKVCDVSAELTRSEQGRKFLGKIDELEQLGLDIDDLMTEAKANGLMEQLKDVSLLDAITDQVAYEKQLVHKMQMSPVTAEKHVYFCHKWLEFWAWKNRGAVTYRNAMAKANLSEWLMGKAPDGENRFKDSTREEARAAASAIAKRLIMDGEKFYSREMLDRVFRLPKHAVDRDNKMSKSERRFRDAYVQGDHELRAGLNESWDNSEVAARYIFENFGGMRPEEIGHLGCPNHPKLGLVPPFSYDIDTGEARVNELGKTGTRKYIMPPVARFLLGILANEGRLILKPLVDRSKAPQKHPAESRKVKPLMGRDAQKHQMTALRGRSGYLNSKYRKGSNHMKPVIKTGSIIRTREIGMPGGTNHPIDEAWEQQVSTIMENARQTPRPFVMIPFGRYILKTPRHTTGSLIVNATGGDLTLAAVTLGHRLSMYLKHYDGRLNLTIWCQKVPQSKGYIPPGTDAFGKSWKETWTGGSNPTYRACKGMVQALPRQVRAMRRIRTVDGGLFSAPLLDADGKVQYFPILDKDGKQVLNNKGEPAFELIRERDMPLPDWFTINPGGNAEELISQRKAFEAYGAQDSARREAQGSLHVDKLRAAATTKKDIKIPKSIMARIKEVLTSNPQLKGADLAKMVEFKDVRRDTICNSICWLRRNGKIPGLEPRPKKIPLDKRVDEILAKTPGTSLTQLMTNPECSDYSPSFVEKVFYDSRSRARQLASPNPEAMAA